MIRKRYQEAKTGKFNSLVFESSKTPNKTFLWELFLSKQDYNAHQLFDEMFSSITVFFSPRICIHIRFGFGFVLFVSECSSYYF